MAVTWKKLAYETDVVTHAAYTAKGAIIGGTGTGTVGMLAVGTNDYVLTAASGETTGLKWAAAVAAAHATSHKSGGNDSIKLNEFAVPTGAVAFSGQQATNFIVHQVADATARDALTAVVGKMAMQIDDLSVYICTVIA